MRVIKALNGGHFFTNFSMAQSRKSGDRKRRRSGDSVGATPQAKRRRTLTATKRVKKEKRKTDDEAVCKPLYQKRSRVLTGRRAKVSRSFKNKVHTALEKNMIRGRYMSINTQQIFHPQTANNSQVLNYLQSANPTNREIGHFGYAAILDAASILWRNKTPALNQVITSADNFNNRTTKVFCFDSKVVYQMRNNTQRRLHIRLYEVIPRSDILAGDPIGIWEATLLFQGPANQGSNANGFSPNALYASPTILPDWNKQFQSKVTKITLDPGQECEYVLQGPQNYMYDLAKAWNGSTYYAIQKHMKYVFLVSNVDLVDATAAENATNLGAGRLITNDAKLGSLIVESVHKFHLGMPEQAGFEYPGTVVGATQQPLNWRQYSYATNNFSVVPVGYDRVNRMDDEVNDLEQVQT